jgi:sigma-B regulation protein RsbU (phosphoserine phosphatase)
MRILIIDDTEEGREIAKCILVAAGYRDVRTAGSAAEAFRFLGIDGPATNEPSSVDLVLLDIVMPDIDGIEACARIRNDRRHINVPIIMITQLADSDSLANAFIAGATDYITKPVNRIELLARVRSVLKLKAELDRRDVRELQFLQAASKPDDGHASRWIDKDTGLFTGELAEAYLVAEANFSDDSETSVIALAIDRLADFRASQGDKMVAVVMSKVAHTVRATAATVGVVAAAYRDGVIVLVAPVMKADPAMQLGEALRAAVSGLRIPNPESISADHFTTSIAVITGRGNRSIDHIHLLTRAISALQKVADAGGDRVMSEFA